MLFYVILLPILIPILGGFFIFFLKFKQDKTRNIFVFFLVLINSLIIFLLLYHRPPETLTVFYYTKGLTISFRIDDLSCIFAGMVSVLWPLASLYSFEYMEHEKRKHIFYAFYTMTYGAVIGIAFAENLLTMYIFYEIITLFTFPLVMHPMTKEAVRASRKYLYYSLGGAAFAFIGLVFVIVYGDTISFTPGGVLSEAASGMMGLVQFIFVVSFCGFSVKAAMFPFHGWLISASVAPTPVTALLHAVAVVKAGAFAAIRLTYYIFGISLLEGTAAQYVILFPILLTILYGSSMAVREQHLKRRLAYSTIANLSYILFGVALMTPLGLIGALSHMLFHGFMKICSFFCIGSVMHRTGKVYLKELNGEGRKMKVTFACFTLAGLALMGLPLLAGFISKWNLLAAAVDSGNKEAYLGVGVLLYSAFMTAIYVLTIVVRAFFPPQKELTAAHREETASDPGWLMKLPILILSVAIVVFGVYSTPFMELFQKIGFEF